MKGNIAILALVIGGLALLGVISAELNIPPLGSGGEEVPVAVSSGNQPFVVGGTLTVNGTGTSTFSGGLDVTTVGGIETQSGLVVTGGDLLLTGLLKSNNVATSAFQGGISVSTAGGLSTVSGLTLTGGSLLGTNIGATLGSTTLTGLSISTDGLRVTGAGFFLGGINVQGTATSTFGVPISTAGLSSSAGLTISAGSALLQGGLNVSGTATSTINDANVDGLTVDTNGITVTAGSILATNIGATFGSTSVGGLTSANGVTLTAGCFKGPTGDCVGAAAGGLTSATGMVLLTCNKPGGTKPCVNQVAAASSTFAVTGLPARDHYEVEIFIAGLSSGANAIYTYDNAGGNEDFSLNHSSAGAKTDGVTRTEIQQLSANGCGLNTGALTTNSIYSVSVYATTSQNKMSKSFGHNAGANAGAAATQQLLNCVTFNTANMITEIVVFNQTTSTETFNAGSFIKVYGLPNPP